MSYTFLLYFKLLISNMAYKAIFDYAQENNINFTIPSREIYIKGPGMIFKGNPSNYITEIIIPIKQEA